MRTDVVDLRDFYSTALGRTAARLVARRARALWADVHDLTVVGYGYAGPVLDVFRGEAGRVLSLMPAQQGVLPWPADAPPAVALAEEVDLPLPDLSVDRLVIMHGLETTEYLRPLMRELWRVLSGDGRLLIVVPNRRGVWSRVDTTPFGNGQPYSASQLGRRLRDHLFTPLRHERAVYVPPTGRQIFLKAADAWEEIGTRWFPQFGGVLLLEAAKQLYAGVSDTRAALLPRYVPSPLSPASRRSTNTAC